MRLITTTHLTLSLNPLLLLVIKFGDRRSIDRLIAMFQSGLSALTRARSLNRSISQSVNRSHYKATKDYITSIEQRTGNMNQTNKHNKRSDDQSTIQKLTLIIFDMCDGLND